MESETRRINRRSFADDVKSGCSAKALMEKYEISAANLNRLLNRLLQLDLINNEDLLRLMKDETVSSAPYEDSKLPETAREKTRDRKINPEAESQNQRYFKVILVFVLLVMLFAVGKSTYRKYFPDHKAERDQSNVALAKKDMKEPKEIRHKARQNQDNRCKSIYEYVEKGRTIILNSKGSDRERRLADLNIEYKSKMVREDPSAAASAEMYLHHLDSYTRYNIQIELELLGKELNQIHELCGRNAASK